MKYAIIIITLVLVLPAVSIFTSEYTGAQTGPGCERIGEECIADSSCSGSCKFIETLGICDEGYICNPTYYNGQWTDWVFNGNYTFIDPDTCPGSDETNAYASTPTSICADVRLVIELFTGYCDEYGNPHHFPGVCPDDWKFDAYVNPEQCAHGQYYYSRCFQYQKRNWEENVDCPAYQTCNSGVGTCSAGACSTTPVCTDSKYYSQRTCDGSGGCTLGYGTVLNPDYSSASCNCQVGSGHWAMGGEVANTSCCGDDAGENYKTRECEGICTSDTDDRHCCDNSNDCVYNSTCYPHNYVMYSAYGGFDGFCYHGVWRNAAPQFTVRDDSGADLATIDDTGYMRIKGRLNKTWAVPSGNDDFVVESKYGMAVAWIDGAAAKGHLSINGTLNENVPLSVNPSSYGNFVIESSGGTAVAWIDSFGNLYLRGQLVCGEVRTSVPNECGTHDDYCGGIIDKGGCGPRATCSGYMYFQEGCDAPGVSDGFECDTDVTKPFPGFEADGSCLNGRCIPY
jgi:hypothetical protein